MKVDDEMTRTNNHPAACLDPDNCHLSYRDHLVGFGVAADAIPSQTGSKEIRTINTREKRWHRDMAAYDRLRNDGLQPPQIDGSALRERQGKDVYDIEHRPVTIDYTDPT